MYTVPIDNIVLNKCIVLYTCWNQIRLITDESKIQPISKCSISIGIQIIRTRKTREGLCM